MATINRGASITIDATFRSLWYINDGYGEILLLGSLAAGMSPHAEIGRTYDINTLVSEAEAEAIVEEDLDWSEWEVVLVTAEEEEEECGRCGAREPAGTMYVGDGECLCEDCMARDREDEPCRLYVDWEVNATEWWEAARRCAVSALVRPLLAVGGVDEVRVSRAEAEAFFEWAATLPGWGEDGSHPIRCEG